MFENPVVGNAPSTLHDHSLLPIPVSMGINIPEKSALPYCKPNTDFAHDVIPQLVRDKKPVFAYLTERRHYDIGTFKSLEEVRKLVETNKIMF